MKTEELKALAAETLELRAQNAMLRHENALLRSASLRANIRVNGPNWSRMASQVIHFVDTETTGLEVQAGVEIIEIAVVTWNDGATKELLHAYVHPKRGCPAEVAKINHYDPAVWATNGAEPWDLEASKTVAELLFNAYMGGSNPAFDQAMIAAECNRTGQPKPGWSHRKLDTSSLGFPLWVMGEVERTGLEALADFFGIQYKRHSALGDAHAAIKVWEAFFEMYIYRPRMMREALEELRECGTVVGSPALSTLVKRGLEGEE